MHKALCLARAASAILIGLMLEGAQASAASQSFAVIGDAGKINANSKSVQASIRRADVRSLVLPGDNLYSGSYSEVWKSWSDLDFSVVAIGNHNNGYENEMNYFDMPGEYYSRTFDNAVRFLVLNSDNNSNVSAQMRWLEGELQKDATMTFLVWHHPTYTMTSYHKWEEKSKFQKEARTLIHRYKSKITALIFGHDHIAAFYCADDIPLIISGAVQETRTPETFNYSAEDGTQVKAQWVFPANTPTWARMDIDSESQSLTVSYIRASDDKVMFRSLLSEAPKSSICRK